MDLDKQIEKAEEALKRRNFDFAINLYLQLLQIAPNNMKARRGLYDAALKKFDRKHAGKKVAKSKRGASIGSSLGILMRSGGRKDPAAVMAACDKVIAKNPRDPTALEKLGYAASKAGHLEAAVFAFERVLDFMPENLQAAKNLGRLHHRLGNIREALDAFTRALKINAGDQEAIKARKDLAAEAAIQGHGYAEAKSAMDLVKDKDKARELDLADRVVKGEDEIAETIRLVEERLETAPEDRKLLMKLGELNEQLGDLDRAREIFEKLAALDPTNFDYKERVGDLKIRAAEDEVSRLEAAARTDPASAAKPGDDHAMAEAGRALLELKVQEYAWRVEAHPTDLPQRFRYGEALYQIGRLDDAIGEFQKTVKDPRKRQDSQIMMANAFMKKDMLDLAASQLEKALEGTGEGTSRSMQIRYQLGMILEKQGKMAEARVQYLQVYERDINFRDIKDRLESIEKKTG